MNYQLEMEKTMQRIPQGTALLLHACCGPCASVALQRLGGHFATTVFYYNPNIAPPEEYARRREALQTLLVKIPLEYPAAYLEGSYAPAAFDAVAEGLEGAPEGGARCDACFSLRLEAAARQAAALGIPWVTTSLTTGPRKDAEAINTIGRQAAERAGVNWLPCDFKKKDGVRLSAALCTEYGLYRQDYCGCVYSMR